MDTVAVIDFETTGLSATGGDRATEIAAVILERSMVVDRYQSLMNAGVRIPIHIQALTGISTAMVETAPPAHEVMNAVFEFVGSHPLVAHNAAFDSRFWDAELARINKQRRQEFACSMLISRRLLPHAPSHKLGALVEFTGIPVAGRFHRALADAEMTACLLSRLEDELNNKYGVRNVTHELLRHIQKTPKHQLHELLRT